MKIIAIGAVVLAAAFSSSAFAAEATGMGRVDYGPGGQRDTQYPGDYAQFARATPPEGSTASASTWQATDPQRQSQNAGSSTASQYTH